MYVGQLSTTFPKPQGLLAHQMLPVLACTLPAQLPLMSLARLGQIMLRRGGTVPQSCVGASLQHTHLLWMCGRFRALQCCAQTRAVHHCARPACAH